MVYCVRQVTFKNTIILFIFAPKSLHKHCFQILLGLTMVPRENKNKAYAKFWRANKEYYGIFESGHLGERNF